MGVHIITLLLHHHIRVLTYAPRRALPPCAAATRRLAATADTAPGKGRVEGGPEGL